MTAGAKILVIDDEVAVLHFLEVALSAQGYTVLQATTGKKGLQQAQDLRPDLVILDLELPDMTGLEVLNKLREWSRVPVIVLTVKSDEDDKVALLESGADDYLTKPFGVSELLARIKVALRHHFGQTHQDIFQGGGLTVNFLARSVSWEAVEIKLTTTEYDLLKILLGHLGKVVTQRQLMREIWGAAMIEHTHYLRIYVAQLRKKLPQLLIVTEPSVGYRLVLDHHHERDKNE